MLVPVEGWSSVVVVVSEGVSDRYCVCLEGPLRVCGRWLLVPRRMLSL